MTRFFGTLAATDSAPARDSGAPSVVLLHGLTFDRHSWAPVIDALRARDPGRRVLAFDLPGHGDTPAQPPHDLPHLIELVHDAVEDAGGGTPVLVGHSMSGALVSMYAARYPAAGVVNVDQPPAIGPFAALLRSIEARLRGPEFDRVFRDVFAASFHTELLPPEMRRLAEANSRPSQELVLGYWQFVLERPVAELEEMITQSMREIHDRRVPYLLVTGDALPQPVRELLRQLVPHARIAEWPGCGHLPQLARPDAFAELVAGVGVEAGVPG